MRVLSHCRKSPGSVGSPEPLVLKERGRERERERERERGRGRERERGRTTRVGHTETGLGGKRL